MRTSVAKPCVRSRSWSAQLLERHLPEARARELAHLLSSGVWTHDHPLSHTELEQLGLPVKFGVPDEERR